MAYNKFRWFTDNRYRNRPLKTNELLLLRIQNGDFETSPYFLEAKDNEKLYLKMHSEFMKTSKIDDINERQVEAHQHAKMKRIKAEKLMEKGIVEEQVRLANLRNELQYEFGKDLWDVCLEKQRGKGTTEDMYHWYQKQSGVQLTTTELLRASKRRRPGKI